MSAGKMLTENFVRTHTFKN